MKAKRKGPGLGWAGATDAERNGAAHVILPQPAKPVNRQLKAQAHQPFLPGLAVYDPLPGVVRVIALSIIYRWPNLERFAWRRFDELREGGLV